MKTGEQACHLASTSSLVSLQFYWPTNTVVNERTLEDGRLGVGTAQSV